MQVPNHPNESLSPEQRRLNRLMAANNPDEPLSPEELQIICSLTVGGFTEITVYARAYYLAFRLILPKVAFARTDIRDRVEGDNEEQTEEARDEAAARADHCRAHTRCRLYRRILHAAVAPLLVVRKQDSNAIRRTRREYQSAIRASRAVGAVAAVADLTERAERHAAAERGMVEERRAELKRVKDDFAGFTREQLIEHTVLRGERRENKIGEIMNALGLGSTEPEAVHKRFTRLRKNSIPTARILPGNLP